MLPTPMTVLGARRYLSQISGESMSGKCGSISSENWLNDDISSKTVPVQLGNRKVRVMASSFVAVASKCIACEAAGKCSPEELANNVCDHQRRFLADDVERWYQAYEPSMYNKAVHGAFRSVVKRIGTGPWGAGVWAGDSQQSFLAVWLATSLLGGPILDYYAYSNFCENPGNQCFVLGQRDCKKCLRQSGMAHSIFEKRCGATGVQDIIAQFQGKSVDSLFQAVVKIGQPPQTVFDLLVSFGS